MFPSTMEKRFFSALLDTILEKVPEPKVSEGNLQLQITSLDYSSFLGRIAIGSVARGIIKENQAIALMQADGAIKKQKVGCFTK